MKSEFQTEDLGQEIRNSSNPWNKEKTCWNPPWFLEPPWKPFWIPLGFSSDSPACHKAVVPQSPREHTAAPRTAGVGSRVSCNKAAFVSAPGDQCVGCSISISMYICICIYIYIYSTYWEMLIWVTDTSYRYWSVNQFQELSWIHWGEN